MIRNMTITAFAGLAAGIVGLGGSVMMGPIMLELGVPVQVSAASTAVMVLFSSGAAIFQFAITGRLNVQHAALFAGLSFIASLGGILVISGYIKRSGRVSLIALILGALIAAGGLLAAIFGGVTAAQAFRNNDLEKIRFKDICI